MNKQHVETRLRRLVGMTPEARAKMCSDLAKTQWRVRCKCGHWTQADYDQILKINCINCGSPLGKKTP